MYVKSFILECYGRFVFGRECFIFRKFLILFLWSELVGEGVVERRFLGDWVGGRMVLFFKFKLSWEFSFDWLMVVNWLCFIKLDVMFVIGILIVIGGLALYWVFIEWFKFWEK